MTTKERVEMVEKLNDVQELKVEKFGKTFQVYPWLKGRLFHKIITGKESNETKTWKLLIRQIRSVFYGWWNYFRKYDIWAFSTSAERRLIEGEYHDKLFDYLGNNSGKKTLIIENRLFDYYPYRKIASNYAVSRSLWMILEELYGRIILRSVKVNSKALLNEILKTANAQIDFSDVIRKYLSQYWLMKTWLKIFPNPKLVLVSVAYTNFGYIRAFKERGVKVVEFQHGLITKNHHAYFYTKSFDAIQFPDEIATVGLKEKNVFDDENNFPVKSIMPIGSYILDYYVGKTVKNTSFQKRVLFAMQDGEIGEKLIQFIVEVIKILPKNIELIIQPRRTAISEYYKSHPEIKNVSVSSQDFYSELLTCDIHSTVYSTTAIEALSLGKQNILINIDNLSVEQLHAVIGENEYTFIANTPSEFLELISVNSFVEKDLIITSNNLNVKSGYKNNINKLLEEIEW